MKQPFIGGAALKQPYIGGAALKQPYIGGAALKQPYIGGAALKQPYIGGAAVKLPYIGGAALKQPYIGGAALKQPYIGGAALKQPYYPIAAAAVVKPLYPALPAKPLPYPARGGTPYYKRAVLPNEDMHEQLTEEEETSLPNDAILQDENHVEDENIPLVNHQTQGDEIPDKTRHEWP